MTLATPAADPAGVTAIDACLYSRRSVRRYAERSIDRATLDALIDAACQAPSNFNRQPWQFVVLDQSDWIAALNGILHRGVNTVEQRDSQGRLYNLLDHVRAWLYPLETSTAVVLAFYKPSPEKVDEEMSSVLESGAIDRYNPNLIALGMAIQNLLIAAHARGIGGCMHSGPLPFLRGAINRVLDLPERLELAGLISLGWPDETPTGPKRRPVERVREYRDGPVPAAWGDVWT